MAVGGIFQLTGVINVQGLQGLQSNLTAATAAGNLFATALEGAFRIVEDGASNAINAFRGFVEDAVKEAIKIDRIKLSFAGLYDDMDMGNSKVAFIRQYARQSVNSADDLLEASKKMEAAGINSGRFIKMMDVLSGVAGPGKLNQFADAFARIASGGNYGMAMRSLRASGIGLNDLKEQGIKVTQGNKIEATSEEMLSALERIFQKKFPKLGDYLAKAMQTKIVDIGDSWAQLLDKFGQTWFPLIGSILDSLQPFINFLTDTGEVTRLGKAFADAFDVLFQIGGGKSGMESFLAYVIAALEAIPDIIKNIGKVTQVIFNSLSTMFAGTMNFIGGVLVDIINFGRLGLASFVGVAQSVGLLSNVNRQELLVRLEKPDFNNAGDYLDTVLKAVAASTGMKKIDIGSRHDEILGALESYKTNPKPALPDPGGGAMFNKIHTEEDTKNLKDIKTNTAKVAAHMEQFKRFALGGGPLGQVGVAVSERYGAGRPVQVSVRGTGNPHFDRGISQMIEEYHQSFRRSAF